MATERPLLAIARRDLDSGPKHVRAEIPAEWLTRKLAPAEGDTEAPELSASQAGSADLQLTPTAGEQYLLQGRVRATIDAFCARCLEPAHVPVDADITVLLVPKHPEGHRTPKGRRSKDSEGEFEFDPEEGDVAHYEGDLIVLDELVREAILLELPISPLCSETCAGISSDPLVAEKLSAARVDPRLAPLAELAKKAKGEGGKKKK